MRGRHGLSEHADARLHAIRDALRAARQGDFSVRVPTDSIDEGVIGEVVQALNDTTRYSQEQDWLKTNLAKFFGVMQGQRNLQSLTDQIMSELTPVVGAQHGAFYLTEGNGSHPVLTLTSTYAFSRRKGLANQFELGEGLVGQCARERKPIIVTEVPPDYVQISSGLGHAAPLNLAVYPVLFEGQVRGVIELGSFHEFTTSQLAFLEQLMLSIGLAINLIGTNMRTEQLLNQLQGSNVELDRRRKELEERAGQLEERNREIAQASASLEAKSQELARVSQYKSQFLTNMSHEIRTPLNSVMILAQMLAANEDKTLTPKQQEWSSTIYAAGRDLLALINQILDLSKVEAGRIEAHAEPYAIAEVAELIEHTFRPVSVQRKLGFSIDIGPGAPARITTDHQLLQQILKNLLANAFKFTEHGQVKLQITRAAPGVALKSATLQRAPGVLAFAVTDTGIGIAAESQQRIFEAFQQGDPSITRKYGGTGLGLAISREYARVIGGEIAVDSTPGAGSTFTLYLPLADRDLAPAAPPPANERATPPPDQVMPGAGAVPASPDAARAVAGRNILVVEDDARNLFAITTMLERMNANVLPASNAREAYAKLRARADIDLVLMDIMMPEIDGFQATREIRTTLGLGSLPIVALTAKASASDRDRCIDAGCNDYVAKPADVRQLSSVIAKYLKPR